ncbi:MAG TPA: MltR family transcriptional regulator [Bryobacteraceae bacterium]|nr:MltR family transcriptional regulator [Bryobacteraceae bacterium]
MKSSNANKKAVSSVVSKTKRSIPTPNELSADSTRFIEDLQKETDRGVALVGAAFLDDAVRALIRAALIRISDTADRLFVYPRPLHSFDARIDLAYCMGLIGKVMYKDLGVVREIRNRFAHQHSPASFDDPETSVLCDKFQSAGISECSSWLRLNARGRFTLAVVQLTSHILIRGLETKHAEVGKDFILGAIARATAVKVEKK